MYQYDDPTAAAALPTPAAPGTAGYFTDGSPGSGEPATILRSDFTNMLMMELLNIVEAAGLTPSKTTYNQVLTAIKTIQAAQIGSGQYLGTQTPLASGTYTPGTYTVGGRSVTASKARFRGQAAGGGGGGGLATGVGQASSGSGGNAGNPFDFWVTAGLAAMSITFGAPGTGVTGANGNSAGNLVIGSIATITGGKGGSVGGLVGAFPVFNALGGTQNAASTIASAGGMTVSGVISGFGQQGNPAILLQSSSIQAGQGGFAPYGSIGYGSSLGSSGFSVGGNGALNGVSVAAAAGQSGMPAWLAIDEYA